MTLASKPPIRRKTNTGMTTAISASDCPRIMCRRLRFFMSVALRLQPDIGDRCSPDRTERGEEAGLPAVGVVDGHADEVAGAVPDVAVRGRIGERAQRRPVECVAVVVAEV